MFKSPVVLFTWLQGATFYRDLHVRAVAQLPAGEGRDWLDFGTGPGLVARLAAARGYRAVGLDSDARMIRAAQRLARCLDSPARFRTASVFEPLPAQAHVVSACSLLAVVPDRQRAVQALWSAVEPGGTLLIVEPTDRMEPGSAGAAIGRQNASSACGSGRRRAPDVRSRRASGRRFRPQAGTRSTFSPASSPRGTCRSASRELTGKNMRRTKRPCPGTSAARSPQRASRARDRQAGADTVAAERAYIIPNARGSTSDSHGQYVTMTRKISIVISQGSTALVSSVIPSREMPDAT